MTSDQQLKLQAFLDGELPEGEAHEILVWTQRNSAAAALLAELRNTRSAIVNSKLHVTLPESREFFWSKIEREIQRREPQASAPKTSWLLAFRRWLIPAAAVSVLVIAGLLAHIPTPLPTVRMAAAADLPPVVTTLANSDATTYRDAGDDTTLVWFSTVNDGPTQKKPATAIN